MNQFMIALGEYGMAALTVIWANFLVGLFLAMRFATRYRQGWLRSAPNFWWFVLGVSIWPVWGLIDFVNWFEARKR